ncbi:MAG: hypothetical protein EZS28_004138 [Streblomastix strix]|uniref:Uncharacterized protein n=1 Tax=Streblomastix strix TaxID=222440 RepID=A0A5J4X0Q7_9EUKA|nr:MAG: hypothetical protein EZS28_004138 [Streblomastix strix]
MAPRDKKTNPYVKALLYISTIVIIVVFLVMIVLGILVLAVLSKVKYLNLAAIFAIIIGVLGIIVSIFGIWGLFKSKLEGKPKYAVLFFAGTVIVLQVLLIVIGFTCFFARPTVNSLIVLNQNQLKTWFSNLTDAKFNTLIRFLKLAVDYLNIVGAIFFVAAVIVILILILLCFYVGKKSFARFLITSSSIVLIVVGFVLAIFLLITNPSSLMVAGQKVLNKQILTAMVVVLFVVGAIGIYGLIAAKWGSKFKILSIIFIIIIGVIAVGAFGVFIAAAALRKRFVNGVDSFCGGGEAPIAEIPEEEEEEEQQQQTYDLAMNYNSDSNPKYLPFDMQNQPDSEHYAVHISTTTTINSVSECNEMLSRLRDSKCGEITDSEAEQLKCRNDLTYADVIDLLKKMKGGWVDLIISVAIYITAYLALNVIAGIYNCVKKDPKPEQDNPKKRRASATTNDIRMDPIGDDGNRF